MRARKLVSTCLMLAAIGAAACDIGPNMPNPTQGDFFNFETIPTRAVAISSDGTRLFAASVPSDQVFKFSVGANGQLTPMGAVTVGLNPIAIALRNNNELWVVNHVSDSVSIVNVGGDGPMRVVNTLLVGDEPRDIVFAGPGRNRAFISAARRGQNHPDDVVNETQVPGLGRGDVWVFDANNLGNSLGGNPIDIVTTFSEKLGPLAVSEDGSQVFVSPFSSGNKTTVINDGAVCGTGGAGTGNTNQGIGPCQLRNGGTSPGGLPAPNNNTVDNRLNPRTGLIVTNVAGTDQWVDGLGRDWGDAVPFSLPDGDLFTIDANSLQITQTVPNLHTIGKGVAVQPGTGRVFVSGTVAVNQNRFLSLPGMGLGPNPDRVGGAAISADPATGRTMRGHLYESRIAVVQSNGLAVRRHLNKHINYEQFPVPLGTADRSTADPQGLLFSPDGNTVFVAATGSNKIVPFSAAALQFNSFQPDASTHIRLSGTGGPTDLVWDPRNGNRMFVYKRFDNAVATVDVAQKREIASAAMPNPEPDFIKTGRQFFYDARFTSDNGEANCNVCHPAGDKDDLAWNLGTPFLGFADNPNGFVSGIAIGIGGGNAGGANPTVDFNPLKGPMTVLTLRGIKDSGPMFWRGDATSATPQDEQRNINENFPLVFDALNGRTGGIPDSQFQPFSRWILSLATPPNPHRGLDNGLNQSQLLGQGIFTNQGQGARGTTDVIFVCNDCHSLSPERGQFGAGGLMSTEGETQFFKVTQLRTTYDKVGMFGHTFGDNGDARTLGGARSGNVGPQVRGTGTLHDGSAAGAEEFLTAAVFQLNAAQLRQVVDFTYAFPNNFAPIVGQQATLRQGSGQDTLARIDLMQQRCATPFVTPDQDLECDLVAHGLVNGQPRGYLFQPPNTFQVFQNGQQMGTISSAQLRQQAMAPGQEVTYFATTNKSGPRLARQN